MNWWTDLTTQVVKDEKWVATELARGWQLLQTVGHTIDVDIQGVFTWISVNHLAITNTLQGALSAFQVVGSITGNAPAVIAATVAVDAATAAVDALSKAVVAGSTPLSTAVNAYHAVKDAETAVTTVLKAGTTKPAAK